MDVIDKILQSLWTMSAPASFAGIWADVPCHPTCRQLYPQALRHLLDDFRKEDLIAAGICQPSDTELRVVSSLETLPTTLVFAREPGEVRHQQVVAGLRGLRPTMSALAALLLDSDFRTSLENWEFGPLLTTSMSELAIYRSLGIPVLPAAGLSRITAKRLKIVIQLWKSLFGDADSLSFILPAFRLQDLRLQRSAYLDSVARHLGKMEHVLRLDIGSDWWTPSPAALDNLRFLLKYSDPDEVRRAMESNYEGMDLLSCAPAEQVDEPHDLASALRDWRRELQYRNPEAHKDAWKTVQKYVQCEIVAPFQQDAQRSSPSQRPRQIAAAPLLQATFSRLLQVSEEINKQLAQGIPKNLESLDLAFKRATELLKSIDYLTGAKHGR